MKCRQHFLLLLGVFDSLFALETFSAESDIFFSAIGAFRIRRRFVQIFLNFMRADTKRALKKDRIMAPSFNIII